ncbi:MAG: hypothetical protein MZU95_04775 [Desulfomicrobium escambiense]|nr:hypothetical protein [Desulfomicrobium escambiense]
MPTHKVFYFGHAPENVYAIIREELPAGLELVTLAADSDDERKRKIADCVVIVAAKPMRREFIDAALRLRLLHHQGVGYQDTVDVAALKARGIARADPSRHHDRCCRAHRDAHARRVQTAHRRQRAAPGALAHQQPAALFLRALRPDGSATSGRPHRPRGGGASGGLGTAGIYHDPVVQLSADEERTLGLSRVSLHELIARADVITLHALRQSDPPPDRRGSARPDEARDDRHQHRPRHHHRRTGALVRAVEGRIWSGLDVFEKEPFTPENPLATLPNVVLTPHIAAGTRDALKTKMRALFQNVQRFFRGQPMENEVAL